MYALGALHNDFYGFIHEGYIGIKDKIPKRNILIPAPGQPTSWKCRRIEIEVPGHFGTPAARSGRVSRSHEHAGLISPAYPSSVFRGLGNILG